MSDPLPPDPYKALSLPRDTTADAVRKAFRKLALTCHPDKTKALPDEERKLKEEQFHSIKDAHDLLVDDDERRRYDLKVEREALLRRRPTYGPGNNEPVARPQPKQSSTAPIFPNRATPVYEYREPKTANYDDYSRSRYETRRPAARPYDDHYYEDSSANTSRRSSGRVAEERRDRREDEERIRKKHEEQRLRDQIRKHREELQRDRDRQKRADRQEARTNYYPHARVDSASETESEVDDFMASAKRSPDRQPVFDDRRHESRKGSSRREEERARRSRSESSSESDSDSDVYNGKVSIAEQYIKRSGGKVSSSGSRSKSSSKKVPTAPVAPPMPPIDTPRRSSARRGPTQSKLSSSKSKTTEIVDPPQDYFAYEARERDRERDRRDSRDSKKSASRTQQPPRPATFNDKVSPLADKPGSSVLRRAATSPMAQPTSAGHTPHKTSNLRHMSDYSSGDSGSDRRGPLPARGSERPAPPVLDARPKNSGAASSTTTKRFIVNEDAVGEPPSKNGYRVVEISPDAHPRGSVRREASPRGKSQQLPFVDVTRERERDRDRDRDRPSTSHRRGISRSHTFDPEPVRRSSTHHGSGSPSTSYGLADHRKNLFGEVTYSQSFTKNDIQYSNYALPLRRGSAAAGGSVGPDEKLNNAKRYMENATRPLHTGRENSFAREMSTVG